jgi:hypothetical protein
MYLRYRTADTILVRTGLALDKNIHENYFHNLSMLDQPFFVFASSTKRAFSK